jgi:hypothetical protein
MFATQCNKTSLMGRLAKVGESVQMDNAKAQVLEKKSPVGYRVTRRW